MLRLQPISKIMLSVKQSRPKDRGSRCYFKATGGPKSGSLNDDFLFLKWLLVIIFAALLFSLPVSACIKGEAKTGEYVWQNITAKAEFPQSYNYPVFCFK